MKLKHLFIFLLMAGVGHTLQAQDRETLITGKVVAIDSQSPIEFATVMIGDPQTETPITGTTARLDGSFEITVKADDFYVEVSFMGFKPHRVEDFEIKNGRLNLGAIALTENTQMMEEVVVRAEKSQTEFQLDKRVFNVGKDLTSAGASVLEVLNNVPGVNVNIENEISLRGSSGVQVLINGKPSVLTSEEGNILGTITAEMVDKIEVITNPSAKYESEGTAGIINIIVKKEERRGTNGSFSINTGYPHNHSFGLSLNRRTEKFNLFTQIGAGYRRMPNDVQNINSDLVNNTTVRSAGEEIRNENFYNLILGTDYHINENNVLTISGNFAYELEDQPSTVDFAFIDDNSGETISEWRRTEMTDATNPKWQYELNYKRDFKNHKDHDLILSAQGSFFGKDLTSEFTNTTISGENNDGRQLTRSDFKEAENLLKIDYTRPLNEFWTLETGAQYVMKDVSNDYAVSDWQDEAWVPNPDFTNVFEYNQKVLGVYGTGAYERKKWGFKAGLRVENTNLNTYLVNTDESNKSTFTDFFPTVHTSYKVTEFFSVQAGYSRRIMRPRLWHLNPFFNIRNEYSIRTGNPDLLPEYTNSYEVSSVYAGRKTSVNFTVFHRYTTDVVERVSIFEDNVNISKPINVGTNRSTGIELNAKYTATEWLTLNGDFNYLFFMRRGTLESTSFDFDGDRWSTRIMAKVKLPADVDMEFTGRYLSKYQTVQSEISAVPVADLGIRKKVLKGRGVINFSMRDVFASRVREVTTAQDDFYVYARRFRGRFTTIGFSYGFGKGEAMEFSGSKRF